LSFRNAERYIFTTEGHLLPIGGKLFRRPWDEDMRMEKERTAHVNKSQFRTHISPSEATCQNPGADLTHSLPVRAAYLAQVIDQVAKQ